MTYALQYTNECDMETHLVPANEVERQKILEEIVKWKTKFDRDREVLHRLYLSRRINTPSYRPSEYCAKMGAIWRAPAASDSYLCPRHADPLMRNAEGKTPLEFAMHKVCFTFSVPNQGHRGTNQIQQEHDRMHSCLHKWLPSSHCLVFRTQRSWKPWKMLPPNLTS